MKILVIGSGGREHAIAKKLLDSPLVTHVFCAKGNPGMKQSGISLVNITETDHNALIAFAKKEQINWTFVGPETPLINGIVDAFEAAGLLIFGPNKKASQIEGSKAFAKQLMIDCHIPTAKYQVFEELVDAKEYVKQQGVPIVIKADGLAAGKGVVVAFTFAEAFGALEDMLVAQKFGESGHQVIIEEYLEGQEFSLLSFVKNDVFYPMVIAQDHKRAYDGDLGPNTGGMGAYSPVPQISDHIVHEAVRTVVAPAVKGMVAQHTPFTGILYAGLIATATGPKVIEFNARFGDPETQVILPRLKSDLAQIIDDLLHDIPPVIEWSEQACVGVVLAAKGYPNEYLKKMPVPVFKEDILTYYAGVDEVEETLVASGGRVLVVAQTAATIDEAKKEIYHELANHALPAYFYRHDIGHNAL